MSPPRLARCLGADLWRTHAHSAIPGGGGLRMERMPAPPKGLIVPIPGGDPAAGGGRH